MAQVRTRHVNTRQQALALHFVAEAWRVAVQNLFSSAVFACAVAAALQVAVMYGCIGAALCLARDNVDLLLLLLQVH
jgi:hypothetical protein